MDLIRDILTKLFWGLFTGLFIWGGFTILALVIYYWIAKKLGIKHKGMDIWWDDNPYDLNAPKKTFKNMPIPHKIATILLVFMTCNQIYYEFTNTDFFSWYFG